MTYAKHLSPLLTPQTQPLPGEPMIKNAAGGYVFELDDWSRLRRFILLGNAGGTYYASERKLTLENAEVALTLIAVDGPRVVRELTEISDKGLAPKNDPAIFVLALASVKGDEITRRAAFPRRFPRSAASERISSSLSKRVRLWVMIGGIGIRKAIAKWYTDRKPSDIAFQAIKYQQRNGVSHRDVLRLAPDYAGRCYEAHIRRNLPAAGRGRPSRLKARKTLTLRRDEGQRLGKVRALSGRRSLTGGCGSREKQIPRLPPKSCAETNLQRELVPTELLDASRKFGRRCSRHWATPR